MTEPRSRLSLRDLAGEAVAGLEQRPARRAALALRPDRPGLVRVVAPVDPQALRGRADVDVLFLVLAAISLIVGAVGIANTTLVAVLERIHEIGVPWTVAAAPAIGAVVGALAGAYPALRAGRIEPSEALRR